MKNKKWNFKQNLRDDDMIKRGEMKEKETNHFDGNDLRGIHIRGYKKQEKNKHMHRYKMK